MIAYSQMTYQDMIDEIVFRLSHYRVAENFDTETIAVALNRAVQSVYVKTLPYKDWAYKATIAITNGTWLTERFVTHERALFSRTGQPPFTEGRFASPKEFFTVTDWSNNQIWNTSSFENPIYTIHGNIIYCSPTLTAQTDPLTSPAVSGILECYLVPAKQFNYAVNVPIPYEYDEFVIMESLFRLMAKVGDRAMLWSLAGRINDIEQNSMVSFKQHDYTGKRELETFVSEEELPFSPPSPIQGELNKQLV